MSNNIFEEPDWKLLATISLAYRSLADGFMDQIGLHRGQAAILCLLFIRDGLTQSEIAKEASLQGATVTGMLQRMEELSLVTRQRDAEDNRLVRVYLTEQGREKEDKINEQFQKLQKVIFSGLSNSDRTVFRLILKFMISNIEGYQN